MSQYIIEFFTLTFLEIILGLDNLIFIAIIVEKLPVQYREKVRFFGISLGASLRILLLFTVSSMMKMTKPLFEIFSISFNGHKLMLVIGGLFLIFKGIKEIYWLIFTKNNSENNHSIKNKVTVWSIITQIIFVDLILSFDSIITAVGLTNHMYIIVSSVLISLIFMLCFTKLISDFIYKHPSIKMLALNFINLIGIFLLLNGLEIDFPSNYLYFAMGFSFINEYLIILSKKRKIQQ